MKGINIFLADGFEDIEALAVNDVLTRGGLKTNLIAIADDPFVVSSHGVTIGADLFLNDMEIRHEGTDQKDIMILPGGMPGSRNLASCKPLLKALEEHYAAGGTVAAICAAPGLVLGRMDIWEGRTFTCFNGFESVPVSKGGVFKDCPAVTDGRVITGRSAGNAIAFGLEILGRAKDAATVSAVHDAMYPVLG